MTFLKLGFVLFREVTHQIIFETDKLFWPIKLDYLRTQVSLESINRYPTKVNPAAISESINRAKQLNGQHN